MASSVVNANRDTLQSSNIGLQMISQEFTVKKQPTTAVQQLTLQCPNSRPSYCFLPHLINIVIINWLVRYFLDQIILFMYH